MLRERKKSKLGRAVMKIKESRYWNGLSLIKRRVNKFLEKEEGKKKAASVGRQKKKPALHLLTW